MDFFYALERHNNLCAIRNKRDYVIFLSEVLKVALVSSVFTSSRRLEEGCEFVKIDGENNRLSVHTLRQIQSVGIPSLNFSHNGDGDPLSITFKGENIDSIFFSFIIKLANLQNNLLISDMENTLANCAAEYTPDVNPKLAEDFLVCFYKMMHHIFARITIPKEPMELSTLSST